MIHTHRRSHCWALGHLAIDSVFMRQLILRALDLTSSRQVNYKLWNIALGFLPWGPCITHDEISLTQDPPVKGLLLP